MPEVLTLEARGRLHVHVITDARRHGVDAFVTDRYGGVSVGPYDSLNLGYHVGDDARAVAENRERVAAAIGEDSLHLRTVSQVHGASVLPASEVTTSSEADALLVDDDHAAAILVADCVPLLIVDTSSRRFALVHAGWRGLRAGVIANAVAALGDPSKLRAYLGPSISRDGYQVGDDVAGHFRHVADALLPDGERYRLDLRRVGRHQLLEAGLNRDDVLTARESTDGGDTFFSDRALRPCGRFALVAKRAS